MRGAKDAGLNIKSRTRGVQRRMASRSASKVYTKNKKTYFRELLCVMRNDAIKEVQEYQNALKLSEAGNLSTELHDQSASFLEREATLMANRQLSLLHSIERAIKRIEEDSYGICVSCEKLIPEERLRLVPHTQHCVACKDGRT